MEWLTFPPRIRRPWFHRGRPLPPSWCYSPPGRTCRCVSGTLASAGLWTRHRNGFCSLYVSLKLHYTDQQSSTLCESRGGRPGLPVRMSLTVSVDVKQHWTMLRHWSQFAPNTSTDIRGHEALHHHHHYTISRPSRRHHCLCFPIVADRTSRSHTTVIESGAYVHIAFSRSVDRLGAS